MLGDSDIQRGKNCIKLLKNVKRSVHGHFLRHSHSLPPCSPYSNLKADNISVISFPCRQTFIDFYYSSGSLQCTPLLLLSSQYFIVKRAYAFSIYASLHVCLTHPISRLLLKNFPFARTLVISMFSSCDSLREIKLTSTLSFPLLPSASPFFLTASPTFQFLCVRRNTYFFHVHARWNTRKCFFFSTRDVSVHFFWRKPRCP